MTKFMQNPNGKNEILGSDGFYISYNPAPMVGPFFGSDDGQSETAISAYGNWYILNGDHRAAYEELYPLGADACIAYFRERPELRSSWSVRDDEP